MYNTNSKIPQVTFQKSLKHMRNVTQSTSQHKNILEACCYVNSMRLVKGYSVLSQVFCSQVTMEKINLNATPIDIYRK